MGPGCTNPHAPKRDGISYKQGWSPNHTSRLPPPFFFLLFMSMDAPEQKDRESTFHHKVFYRRSIGLFDARIPETSRYP